MNPVLAARVSVKRLYGCRMTVPNLNVRQVLVHAARNYSPPVLGALYFGAWMIASTNRFGDPSKVALYALFAIAIGLSGRFPDWALVLLAVTPMLQIAGLVFPPENTTWPTYVSAGLVAFFIGFSAVGVVRYVALPVGAAVSILIAYCIVTGGVFARLALALELTYGPHPLRTGLAVVSLCVFGLFSGGWIIGVAGASMSLRHTLTITKTKLEASTFQLRLSQVREEVARDVHDALAHSLAIVVAQAEGAVALNTMKPDVAVSSLRNIATLSRAALIDVRRLVEKIQAREDVVGEKPSMSDITPLLERFRDVGMNATLQELGDPSSLGALQELAVYRITQESLTNALKHAGTFASPTVTFTWTPEGLNLRIASEMGTPLIPKGGGPGVGIAGMKERARLAGGWLEADKSAKGTFLVHAFIPASNETSVDSEEFERLIAQGPTNG
jgi:signal transduction histidine kinase